MERNKNLSKLVEQAMAGNQSALESLCRLLQCEIKQSLSKIFNDPEIIQDLSQETFIRLINSFKNIREPIKIKNYVSRIVLFVVNDYFSERYKWKDIIIKHYDQDEKQLNSHSSIQNEEEILNKIMIQELLQKVPDLTNKQILKLKYEGKKYKEISDELKLSEGSVKMRFKRSIEYLKKHLNM